MIIRVSGFCCSFRAIRFWCEPAVLLLLSITLCPAAMSQSTAVSGISLPTEVRVQGPGWWPTKGDAPKNEFVGTAVCARCHVAKAASYRAMPMSMAASAVGASEVLRKHDHLSATLGPYREEIVTSAGKSVLSVSDGTSDLSRILVWAFGLGRMGQTYIYEQDGAWYESHLSFYAAPQALDVTPGQSRATPARLEDGLGRRMNPGEPRLCFGCHTTASTTGNQFDPQNAVPGVTCEACHGPGAQHVAAMTLSDTETAKMIFNPGELAPAESVDFCGACHRTWQDVVKNGFIGLGVFNVRFAPYRLENSKCWGGGGTKLTCIACHDPHKPLVSDSASYDSNCLQCHVLRGAKPTREHPGKACAVSEESCVACHMPKIEPPNLHSTFTDHWIRIAKPGKPYPN